MAWARAAGESSTPLAPRDGAVVDPFGGLADLERRVLRATTGQSFEGDPLRVLRLVRLLVRLPGFSVEPDTFELARGAAPRLPGIAAERIREELRNGKTPPSAVDQGFSHAWITIVDTHVTTIVSAAILFIFGTGPVKGFATTLTFGLLANLFTAVFVSRFIFDWVLSRKQRGEALSI